MDQNPNMLLIVDKKNAPAGIATTVGDLQSLQMEFERSGVTFELHGGTLVLHELPDPTAPDLRIHYGSDVEIYGLNPATHRGERIF